MSTRTLGAATVSRIIEIDRSSFPTASMLPDSTPDAIARHHGWLRPHFWDEATGDLGSRIGTYIVRTPRHTVLIDTGVGNDKARDGSPAWHMRRGAYLDDLRAAGVTPERVDVVLCTHLHVDHVGWNTRRVGDRWVPTFPNARYIFAGEEWEFWRHEKDACIADSVMPVVEAGQADLVDADYVVDAWLRFEPTPGHTPGHVSVRLSTSAGDAVFSGDLMHRTVQVAERHADSGVLILAAHFPTPGFVVRTDGGYRFVPAA